MKFIIRMIKTDTAYAVLREEEPFNDFDNDDDECTTFIMSMTETDTGYNIKREEEPKNDIVSTIMFEHTFHFRAFDEYKRITERIKSPFVRTDEIVERVMVYDHEYLMLRSEYIVGEPFKLKSLGE